MSFDYFSLSPSLEPRRGVDESNVLRRVRQEMFWWILAFRITDYYFGSMTNIIILTNVMENVIWTSKHPFLFWFWLCSKSRWLNLTIAYKLSSNQSLFIEHLFTTTGVYQSAVHTDNKQQKQRKR